jgi:hypothetical protein
MCHSFHGALIQRISTYFCELSYFISKVDLASSLGFGFGLSWRTYPSTLCDEREGWGASGVLHYLRISSTAGGLASRRWTNDSLVFRKPVSGTTVSECSLFFDEIGCERVD